MHKVTMKDYGVDLAGEEGSVAVWYFENGDHVDLGSVLCDVAVTKTQFEIEAQAAGKLEILLGVEEPFDESTVIARIV